MAYSSDFRQRVLDACDRGQPKKDVAAMFGVAGSWVRRLKQWRRERGSVAPRPCGGSKPKLGPAEEQAIHAYFGVHPDTTIAELKTALQTEVTEVTVWRTARRLGYRFKKSRPTRPSRIAPTLSRVDGNGPNRSHRSTRAG